MINPNQTDFAGQTIDVGWLIDGTGAPVREKVRLTLADDRLIDIVDLAPLEDPPLPDLDFSDCTVIPGLIDAHVHLWMSADLIDKDARAEQRGRAYGANLATMKRRVAAMVAYGLVAVRDGGDRQGQSLRLKGETERDRRLTIHSPGWAFHAPGRYGALIGRACHGALDQAVRRIAPGADHLKLVNSGVNSLVRFGRRTEPQFTAEQLTAAVRVAAGRGLKTMVHVNGEEAVGRTIAAGADSVEHGFFMGRDNLAKMADRGTVWVPTSVTMAAYARVMAGRPEGEVAARILDNQLDQLRLARELGVVAVVGSDAGSTGVIHGPSLYWELALFIEAGWPVERAVAAAGATAADLLGLADGFGRLTRGGRAVLVVLAGPPGAIAGPEPPIQAVYNRGWEEIKRS